METALKLHIKNWNMRYLVSNPCSAAIFLKLPCAKKSKAFINQHSQIKHYQTWLDEIRNRPKSIFRLPCVHIGSLKTLFLIKINNLRNRAFLGNQAQLQRRQLAEQFVLLHFGIFLQRGKHPFGFVNTLSAYSSVLLNDSWLSLCQLACRKIFIICWASWFSPASSIMRPHAK